ncbi:hybrid sensor histidine kinase/response regulator [Anaerobaca lacustris]|uniref:histidine kinase n=1 Tax=Anaerobaca lacustris TaxID=3044600 RepID=A0AAW6TWV2_9BACT|nr:ATP-binding protein [Sedimentisphaerales bacterium M17dextr]
MDTIAAKDNMNLASTKPLKILVVEDDAIDRAAMQRLLAGSSLPLHGVVFVADLDKATAALADGAFDILLLDLNLPDSDGLDTLMALEADYPDVAKVVVTGADNEELGLQAVAAGAQDYLVKGRFNVDAITRVVHYSVERKKLEEALRHSRGKLNAMLESIRDPMVMIDKDLNVVWSNEATREIFGDDGIGGRCHQSCDGRDAAYRALCCIAMQTLRDGQPHSCDVTLADKSGLLRFFHCTTSVALRDREGNPTAVMAIAGDVTDRRIAKKYSEFKRLEAADHKLKELQSHLIQSEKLASIGQLAAGVAHEMNTPIGFVACNFETLEKHVKKILALIELYTGLERTVEAADAVGGPVLVAPIRQFRQTMRIDAILKNLDVLFEDSREGLERVTEIIQNLRDFSRVDQSSDFARYNINEGLAATLVVARNAIKYNADVVTEFGEIPEIFCHPGQINQVFLNLVVNAVQAIESQERQERGRITIRTYPADSCVVCEIEDDGPGIAPEDRRKVFDPFFTTKPAGKGTGMGLSISYDITVNKHKGRISVESEIDRGTLFTVRLPLQPVRKTDEDSRNLLTGVTADE